MPNRDLTSGGLENTAFLQGIRAKLGSRVRDNRALTAVLAGCTLAFMLSSARAVKAEDKGIRILCSNGIRAAVEKLVPEYERTMGRRIILQFGGSAELKRSIESGDSFDLAIMTSQLIGDLTKEGKIAAAVDLATSGIGIAVRAGRPKPDVTTPQTIKQMLLEAKSIGYVKEGGSTPAIIQMINRLGISEDVRRKTVFQPGAVRSMASLAGGETDVAFALISEILPAPGVQLAGPLPPEFQQGIIMSAGISSSTKNREAASEIIKSLMSAAAEATIKATGLDPIAKEK